MQPRMCGSSRLVCLCRKFDILAYYRSLDNEFSVLKVFLCLKLLQDQKCVEVPVTQPGIPKETCEDICHPDTAFIKDVVQQSPGPQQGYKEV